MAVHHLPVSRNDNVSVQVIDWDWWVDADDTIPPFEPLVAGLGTVTAVPPRNVPPFEPARDPVPMQAGDWVAPTPPPFPLRQVPDAKLARQSPRFRRRR